MLDAIKALPQVSSIDPTFDHMAIDTSWERKMLKKLDWLQEPGMVTYCTCHILLLDTAMFQLPVRN